FGHPVRESPTLLTAERAAARASWMQEEVAEFLAAASIADQADAMIDLIYFAVGTMVEMGVRPERLFDIVPRAKLRRLGPDGQPRFRDDGKPIKPPAWVDPGGAIREEIERQSRQ